jgi:hypothetical protein
MIVAIADTHATIWYLFSDPRLGSAASAFIDDTIAKGAAPTSTMRSWLSIGGAATGPLQLGESTSEKGKSNPSWPSFVNEHTQDARWELQSLFKILRRPRNGS